MQHIVFCRINLEQQYYYDEQLGTRFDDLPFEYYNRCRKLDAKEVIDIFDSRREGSVFYLQGSAVIGEKTEFVEWRVIYDTNKKVFITDYDPAKSIKYILDNIEFSMYFINQRHPYAIKKYAKQAKVQGFRPGHAPKKMVEEMYGSRAFEDAINEQLNKKFATQT